MDNPISDRIDCPHCNADNSSEAAACWSCGESLQLTNPFAEDGVAAEKPPAVAHRTFTLGSLLLITTLIAVCLAIAVQAPGIGIPLAALSAPALIRTILIRARRRNKGEPMTATDKSLVFLGSLAIVTLIGAASCTAFCAICFSMGLVGFNLNSEGLMILGWILGIAVGLLVGGLLVRALWWIRY